MHQTCFPFVVSLLCTLTLLFTPLQAKPNSQNLSDLESHYRDVLKAAGQGNYDTAIPELKKIVEQNPQYTRAYRSLVEAFIFTDKLAEARNFFTGLNKKDLQNGYVYYCLARLDLAQGDYDAAIANLRTCIKLNPEYADAYSHYDGLPEVYRAKKDLEAGVAYFRNLIENSQDKTCAYYGLARCYMRQFQFEKALPLLKQAIELKPDFTHAYQSVIVIETRSSKYNEAMAHSKKLLAIAEQKNDFDMAAYAAMMIGNIYYFQGDYANSLSFLNQALKTAQEFGDKNKESNCLNTMAAIYAMTSDFQRALQYFNQALLLAQKSGNSHWQLNALINIGNVHKDAGQNEKAFEAYNSALQLARSSGLAFEESLVMTNMAESFQRAGDLVKALALQKQALKIALTTKEEAHIGFVYKNLGNVYLDLNNYSQAVSYLNRAYDYGIKTNDLQILWETEAGLGSCFQKQGRIDQAIKHYASAIAIYDSVRNMLDIESLQNNFLEDKYQAYPSIISLLAQFSQLQEAFRYAEKYKAKTLLDIVSRGKNFFSGFLSDSLKSQLQEINSEHEATHRQLSAERAKATGDEDIILALDQKITDLELRKSALFNELKNNHADYFQLTSPEIISVDSLQKQILSPEQALVEFIVGPQSISVFVITDSQFEHKEIAVAREQLLAMLSRLCPVFNIQARGALAATAVFNPQLTDFSITPAFELYNALFHPIAEIVRDKKQITIIPDDILFYLPFEILVCDKSGIETEYDFGNARFLIEKYAISYCASASLLNPGLQKSRTASKGILALGNPEFKQEHQGVDELVAAKDFTGGVTRGDYLVDLPNTETEVKSIAGVLNRHSNSIFLGSNATEANFKQNAKDFGIIHLATHFLSDDDQPLYSKIALAQSNEGSEDGYLQTYEIFNMNLNADLAVLSACNTGLGQLRKGEGIIGMARAFLFAGVPSLVVSLWNVDDKSTSVIMASFYIYLEAGLDKAHALQKAKIDYLQFSPAFAKDPFYWAPFILIGDGQPVVLPQRAGIDFRIILPVLVLLAVGVFVFLRLRMKVARS